MIVSTGSRTAAPPIQRRHCFSGRVRSRHDVGSPSFLASAAFMRCVCVSAFMGRIVGVRESNCVDVRCPTVVCKEQPIPPVLTFVFSLLVLRWTLALSFVMGRRRGRTANGHTRRADARRRRSPAGDGWRGRRLARFEFRPSSMLSIWDVVGLPSVRSLVRLEGPCRARCR